MSKAYSKGAKRRVKKLAGVPDLAEAPRKKERGKKRMGQINKSTRDQDATKTVLEARARHTGHNGDLADMRNPALSEGAGMAIYAVHDGNTAKALWETYTAFSSAEMNYAKRYLGARLHAKTAKIEMEPERIETRADDRPDFRSEEEKARDASNAWARWRGYIGRLGAIRAQPIFDVWRGRVETMSEGKITHAGRDFVSALYDLHKEVAKRR